MEIDVLMSEINAPNACGEDPRYLDSFEAIQIEIEKLNNCDYDLVVSHSQQLLAQQAKDLRVAAYLCLGLTFQQGVSGLCKGMNILCHLIERYGQELHPGREIAKKNALKWLNNPKFEAFVQRETLNHDDKASLVEMIAKLNNIIEQQFGKDYPRFTCINSWLNQVEVVTEVKANKISQLVKKVMPSAQPAETEIIIDNEKEALNHIKKIISFYHKEKNWLTAARYARVLRWGKLSLPPSKENKTHVQPVRKEALKQLEVAVTKHDPVAVLSMSESMFLQAGGQFKLDLQWYAYQSAEALGDELLAQLILSQLQALIENYPTLPKLMFNDGSCFASDECRQWIESTKVMSQSQEPIVKDRVAATVRTSTQLLQLALASSNKKSLTQVNKALDVIEIEGVLEQVHQLHAKAKAALKYNEKNIAFSQLMALHQQTQRDKLYLWHKESAMAIWHDLLQLLNSHGKKLLPAEKLLILQNEIRQLMCQTDFNLACSFGV